MKTATLKMLAAIPMCWSLSLAQITEKHHSQADIDCQECHTCSVPTFKNPCLSLFPDFRREGVSMRQSAEQAEEIIVISSLADAYEPTIFTHKLHAEMSAMSGDCETCHHNNPPGQVLACSECHAPEQSATVGELGLKGAFHRQCLNCHREWSHVTDCTVCHVRAGQQEEDKSRFLGKTHAELETPDKMVIETGEEDLPLVTFYHSDHAGPFGLKCRDCHENQSCRQCHDQTVESTTERDTHDACINCHEPQIDDDCEFCHAVEERPPFDHAAKGWALNRYHRDLPCQQCHPEPASKPSERCLSCHSEWNQGRFDHAITGLMLNADHIDLDCADCHADGAFATPGCLDCHDDYSYPDQQPGKKLKR